MKKLLILFCVFLLAIAKADSQSVLSAANQFINSLDAEQKAKAVYEGYEPLLAEDIANTVYYCAGLPPHVCINDLVITCTAQANSYYTYKE